MRTPWRAKVRMAPRAIRSSWHQRAVKGSPPSRKACAAAHPPSDLKSPSKTREAGRRQPVPLERGHEAPLALPAERDVERTGHHADLPVPEPDQVLGGHGAGPGVVEDHGRDVLALQGAVEDHHRDVRVLRELDHPAAVRHPREDDPVHVAPQQVLDEDPLGLGVPSGASYHQPQAVLGAEPAGELDEGGEGLVEDSLSGTTRPMMLPALAQRRPRASRLGR